MAEGDFAAQAGDRFGGGLHHFGFGVDEGKYALGGRETILELAPEGGDAQHGKPVEAHGLHEEIPFAGRHPGRAA